MRIEICLAFLFMFFFNSLVCCQEGIKSNRSETIIPVEYRRHIYINGMVNDTEGNFVFDTGADNLYFDSLFYNNGNFRYDSIAVGMVPGAGRDIQKVKIIINPVSFDFAGLNYQTRYVAILSLKTILGDFADGIIGLDCFDNKILEINYPLKYLKVYDQIDTSALCEYNMIQCQRIKDRLYIPLTLNINDSVSISDRFLLDLGCGSAVALTTPVALKYNLEELINDKARYFSKYRGVGGESESWFFAAKSLEIGGYKVERFEAEYSTDKRGSLSSQMYAGLIGNRILERFDLIIDFQTSCIYIKPNRNFSDAFIFSRLGFSFVDRSETLGALIVTGLFDDSHADRCGLQIDDMIVALDNISLLKIDYKCLEEYIEKANSLLLTVKRGESFLTFEIVMSQILKND